MISGQVKANWSPLTLGQESYFMLKLAYN